MRRGGTSCDFSSETDRGWGKFRVKEEIGEEKECGQSGNKMTRNFVAPTFPLPLWERMKNHWVSGAQRRSTH
jgi:hypothetical protein